MKKIIIETNSDEDFVKKLGLNLHMYNQKNCEFIRNNSTKEHNFKEIINFSIYDNDIFVGGASGEILFGWYHLNQLWLAEGYRKLGIGSKIIENIEELAKNSKCFGIKTETWDFQAKDFYKKNGFEVYSQLDNFPPGSVEYHLKKLIDY